MRGLKCASLFDVFGDYCTSGEDAKVTKSLDVTENDDVNP